MTKFKLNNFIGYRYRRYAVASFAIAVAWPFEAMTIYMSYPSWLSALVSAAFAFGLSIPLAWLGGFLLHRANQEFAARDLQPILGVVTPIDGTR